MIARFDGASSRGRLFDQVSMMRWTPGPRSADSVDRPRCRSSDTSSAARAPRRSPGPPTRSKTSTICFSAGGLASITSSPRTTANGSPSDERSGAPAPRGRGRAARPGARNETLIELRDLADLFELLRSCRAARGRSRARRRRSKWSSIAFLPRPVTMTMFVDARRHGLFDAVLDDRLVDQRPAFPWAGPWWRAGTACRARRRGRRALRYGLRHGPRS